MNKLTLLLSGETEKHSVISWELQARESELLSQSIYLSGFVQPRPLCSGIGRCGVCRVRFVGSAPELLPADLKILGKEAVAQGWRLSCIRKTLDLFADNELAPEQELVLELPAKARALAKEAVDKSTVFGSQIPQGENIEDCALALDLGTTSIHWSLLAANSSSIEGSGLKAERLDGGVFINPQMGAGADVVSRLAKAANPDERRLLQALFINGLHRELHLHSAQRPQTRVNEVCLAANSAMTMIALGKDVSGLLGAPYRLDYRGGCREEVDGLPPLWVAPLLSAFVGGDISAGVAALSFDKARPRPLSDYPFLLSDLGTNGEFALCLSPAEAIVTSVPMGPALEGIGLSCGSLGGPGVNDVACSFELTPAGLIPLPPQLEANADKQNVENAPDLVAQSTHKAGWQASHLSATAYLNLLHRLLQLGILQQDGSFTESIPLHPLAKKAMCFSQAEGGGSRFKDTPAAGKRFFIGPKKTSADKQLYLASEDIEEIMKVKAAYSLAIHELLKAAGLRFAALKRIYVAGSLGKHVQLSDLEGLGFFPPGGALLATAVGNASLAGAELFIKDRESRDLVLRWAEGVAHLELTSTPNFTSIYVDQMRFAF